MNLGVWMKHLRGAEREMLAEYLAWQEKAEDLRGEIGRGLSPLVIAPGTEMTASDMADYFVACDFQKARLDAAKKEEFAASQRISECREELMAIRQAQKQLDRFMARREDLARARRQRLQSEEMMALGISRQQISGEAVYRRGRAGIQSTRLPGRASGPGRPDPGHSPGEAGDLS